jgi:hypothetical protein
MHYLFTDDDHWQDVIEAKSFRGAVQIARDRYQIRGRIVLTFHVGHSKEWRLVGTAYGFSLREVPDETRLKRVKWDKADLLSN